MTNKTLFHLKLYPFIIGMLPVLIPFTNNLGEVEFFGIWRSLLIAIILTAFFLLICWLLFRDIHKASLLTSAILIPILAYGHIYDGLKETEFLIPLARHRFLLVLILVSLLGFSWLLWKRIKRTKPLEDFFTWFCIFLLLAPFYKLGSYYLFSAFTRENAALQNPSRMIQSETKPDVYYIILDGYGRLDTLNEFYGFDNSEFISELDRLGFYVAPESTSNYAQTLLSLTSSLNYQYLDETLVRMNPKSQNRSGLSDKVWHSRVRQTFSEAGYDFVAFEAGYTTSVQDADIYYKYPGSPNQEQTLFLSMNAFEGMLFDKTFARLLIDFGLIDPNLVADALDAPFIEHRGRVLFTFEKLEEIPSMDGDYFVFAHIIAPHPPFVFGKNGELVVHSTFYSLGDTTEYAGTRDEYIKNYTDQLTYVNSLALRTVKTILAESETPPIIIIQGDHGPGAYLDFASKRNSNMRDRFSILNAYYLAGRQSDLLYPSISPVNSFRVVLNEFFGMDLEFLPDRNFFSLWLTPFKLQDVTGEVTPK